MNSPYINVIMTHTKISIVNCMRTCSVEKAPLYNCQRLL